MPELPEQIRPENRANKYRRTKRIALSSIDQETGPSLNTAVSLTESD